MADITGGGWWEALPLNGLGVLGLIVMVGLMNWRGLLEFRPTIERREAQYQKMLEDKDRQIKGWQTTADKWQQAFMSSQTANAELRSQNGDLLKSAELVTASWEVIRAEAERKSGR